MWGMRGRWTARDCGKSEVFTYSLGVLHLSNGKSADRRVEAAANCHILPLEKSLFAATDSRPLRVRAANSERFALSLTHPDTAFRAKQPKLRKARREERAPAVRG